MSTELIDKTISLLNNVDNLSTEILLNSLTYEEREAIVLSNELVCIELVTKLGSRGLKLITIDEVSKFYEKNEAIVQDFYENTKRYMEVVDFSDEQLIELFNEYKDFQFLYKLKNQASLENIKDELTDEDYIMLLVELFIKRLPDKEKIKYLGSKDLPKSFRPDVLSCFTDDNFKVRYLSMIPRESRNIVINSIKDENLRKQQINRFLKNKGSVIETLTNDIEKEKYLRKYSVSMSNDEKIDIVFSFKNIEFLKRYLSILKPSYNFSRYISSKNIPDELKMYIINKFMRDEDANEFYSSLEGNEYLQEAVLKKVKHVDGLLLSFISNNINLLKLVESKLDKRIIRKAIKDDVENCDFNLLVFLDDEKIIFDTIGHISSLPKYEDQYFKIFELFAKTYNLNLNHLIEVAKLTNCSVLQQLQNKNIVKLINMEDENFKKFLRLFDSETLNLDKNLQNTVINSLLQRVFRLENPDKIDIFTNTLHAVSDGNFEAVAMYINTIGESIDISSYGITKKNLLDGIINSNEKVISLYNRITRDYLLKERNKYVQDRIEHIDNMYSGVEYERRDLIKYLLRVFTDDKIISIIRNGKAYLPQPEIELINDEVLLKNIIFYLKNPKMFDVIPDDVKLNLKKFNEMFYAMPLERILYSDYPKFMISNIKCNRKYYSSISIDKSDLVTIMSSMDIDQLVNTVFSDDSLYNDLISLLKKYKFASWIHKYEELCASADITFDGQTIASIISNFSSLHKTMYESELFTLTSIIDIANSLVSNSNIYAILLGTDNYDLIKRNPPPFPGRFTSQERLSISIDLLKKMQKRDQIAVPPIDKNFELPSKKQINIMIGNTNDPINLTYGERTKACMRIGGAAESLFEFCLLNENGFHISFNDPKTGKLISRVSGFRNGNTLFLNQLRNSLNIQYTTEDLIDACNLVAQEMINLTKSSKFPIENVVVSPGYCYAGMQSKAQNLNVSNIGYTLPKFYHDVDEFSIVVATANEDNTLVPVKLGANRVEKYKVSRKKPQKLMDDSIGISVSRIEALDQLYGGKDVSDIIVEDKTVVLAFVGEDWYAYLDNEGNIKSYIMQNSKNKFLAQQEMQSAILEIEKSIESVEKSRVIR